MTDLVMPALDLAAQEVANFEGFRSKPYYDGAHVATIGFGSTHYPTGKAVTMDDREIFETEALCYLEHDLTRAALTLWKFITRQPTLHEWSAMLSLAYNMGAGTIGKSELVRLFNAGCVTQASQQFARWDHIHVNGKLVESPGLLNRRNAERTLFLTPDTGA